MCDPLENPAGTCLYAEDDDDDDDDTVQVDRTSTSFHQEAMASKKGCSM